MMGNAPFIISILLVLIGITAMLTRYNLIKVIIGLTIVEAGVNLFIVSLGYREGGIAPIFTGAQEGAVMVMPTVQAMTLTNIVIGLATTALLLSFVMLIYRRYGTCDIREIRRLRG